MSNLSLVETIEKLWESVREFVPVDEREYVAGNWVKRLESEHGCDSLHWTRLGTDAGAVHDEERGSHWPWQYV